jgi:peptidoglycan/xylan/chitin deacetylase (PgdA/CDA1 family)
VKGFSYIRLFVITTLIILMGAGLFYSLEKESIPSTPKDYQSPEEESLMLTISALVSSGRAQAAEVASPLVALDLAAPYNNQIFKVVKGEKKGIGFTVIGSSSKNSLHYQVAYRKVGASTWHTFGKYPVKGPNGIMTIPNMVTNSYTDNNGWTCRMKFGENLPPDCKTPWIYNNLPVRGAISDEPVYFPGITLSPGNYEWTTRAKIAGNIPESWVSTKHFSIMELPGVVTSLWVPTRKVALTFDDGPNYTHGICEILERYNAKATFFYIATRLQADRNAWKDAESCGEVASHTVSHIKYPPSVNFSTIYNDIVSANRIFSVIMGKTPRWFRVRGGIYNLSVIDAAQKNHENVVNWNIEAQDYTPYLPTRAQIVSRVLNSPNLKPGAIILLHETYSPTREALPTILSELKNRGYTVTTISDLVDSSR